LPEIFSTEDFIHNIVEDLKIEEITTKKKYIGKADYHWNRFFSKHFIRRFVHQDRYFTILNTVKSNREQFILDIGCGGGVLLSLLAQYFDQLIGLDISLLNLKKIQEIKLKESFGRNLEIVLGDAENLPFKNSIISTVIASEVIEHLPTPQKGLKEAVRVSKHDVIITLPNFLNLLSISIFGGYSFGGLFSFIKCFLRGLAFLGRRLGSVIRGEIYSSYGKEQLPHRWYSPFRGKRIIINENMKLRSIQASGIIPPIKSRRLKDMMPFNLLGYTTIFLIKK